MSTTKSLPPLTDAILFALAKLVDDAQVETREPSHADIEFCIQQAKLQTGDPKTKGLVVGKEKRVRALLSWAFENDFGAGQLFVGKFIDFIRSRGGFRSTKV
jgi:hypothetical protein